MSKLLQAEPYVQGWLCCMVAILANSSSLSKSNCLEWQAVILSFPLSGYLSSLVVYLKSLFLNIPDAPVILMLWLPFLRKIEPVWPRQQMLWASHPPKYDSLSELTASWLPPISMVSRGAFFLPSQQSMKVPMLLYLSGQCMSSRSLQFRNDWMSPQMIRASSLVLVFYWTVRIWWQTSSSSPCRQPSMATLILLQPDKCVMGIGNNHYCNLQAKRGSSSSIMQGRWQASTQCPLTLSPQLKQTFLWVRSQTAICRLPVFVPGRMVRTASSAVIDPWYFSSSSWRRSQQGGHSQSMPWQTTFSSSGCQSALGRGLVSPMTLQTEWLYWKLRISPFPSPTPRIRLQVRLVVCILWMDSLRVLSHCSTSLSTKVKGLPKRLSFPKLGSGQDTPIYETASWCSLTPESTPIQPTKPMLSQALPNLGLLGWQTMARGYLRKGPSRSQSRALICTVCPSLVALPQAPSIEQAPLVSSPIMWMRLKYLKSTPLASEMPLISSQYLELVKRRVISQLRSSTVPRAKLAAPFLMNLGSFLGMASSTCPSMQAHSSPIMACSSSLSSAPCAQPIWYMLPSTWMSFILLGPSPISCSSPYLCFLMRVGCLFQMGSSLVQQSLGLPWQQAARVPCSARARSRIIDSCILMWDIYGQDGIWEQASCVQLQFD